MTPFTPEEDAAILRGGWDDRTLADMLFMSVTTLRDRRAELTCSPREAGAYWTSEEDALISAAREKRTRYKVVARQLGRTVSSVQRRERRIFGAGARRLAWTSEQDCRVIEAARRGVPYGQLAVELGRTHDSIASRSQRLRGIR